MTMSAQKGLYHVSLCILSPLMCSAKGNHLERGGMGLGVPSLDHVRCSVLPFQRAVL